MARVALGFFLQHREILLSLSGISDLKEAVELMSSTLAPATAAAITQFGLTAHIADSVVEALRARARRLPPQRGPRAQALGESWRGAA